MRRNRLEELRLRISAGLLHLVALLGGLILCGPGLIRLVPLLIIVGHVEVSLGGPMVLLHLHNVIRPDAGVNGRGEERYLLARLTAELCPHFDCIGRAKLSNLSPESTILVFVARLLI